MATNHFRTLNKNLARNVIVMIGDGMDLATCVAGRIKIGQDEKKLGEDHVTTLDSMPSMGLVKTYNGLNFE